MLVIEGDLTVARLLVEVFTQQGWDVHVPRDGPGVASALLGDSYFNIITVSYRFPATNGVEIIRLIRELEHRKATPVLMMTGGPDMTGEALAAGANEVLYKPIEPGGLVAAIIRHSFSLIAS
jgi:DNA-binding response OmpR family regulator